MFHNVTFADDVKEEDKPRLAKEFWFGKAPTEEEKVQEKLDYQTEEIEKLQSKMGNLQNKIDAQSTDISKILTLMGYRK